jgi:hypothetical protein
VGYANHHSEESFYRVGQGALGVSLWNQGGSDPKKLGTAGLEYCLDVNNLILF